MPNLRQVLGPLLSLFLSLFPSLFISLFIGPNLHAATKKSSYDPNAIHIQIGGEPSTLEATQAIDQYSIGILRNVVEGLFKLDPSGKLKNGLVQSYFVSEDKLTYTFKLKKSFWSD